jgi:hypothetical protein
MSETSVFAHIQLMNCIIKKYFAKPDIKKNTLLNLISYHSFAFKERE